MTLERVPIGKSLKPDEAKRWLKDNPPVSCGGFALSYQVLMGVMNEALWRAHYSHRMIDGDVRSYPVFLRDSERRVRSERPRFETSPRWFREPHPDCERVILPLDFGLMHLLASYKREWLCEIVECRVPKIDVPLLLSPAWFGSDDAQWARNVVSSDPASGPTIDTLNRQQLVSLLSTCLHDVSGRSLFFATTEELRYMAANILATKGEQREQHSLVTPTARLNDGCATFGLLLPSAVMLKEWSFRAKHGDSGSNILRLRFHCDDGHRSLLSIPSLSLTPFDLDSGELDGNGIPVRQGFGMRCVDLDLDIILGSKTAQEIVGHQCRQSEVFLADSNSRSLDLVLRRPSLMADAIRRGDGGRYHELFGRLFEFKDDDSGPDDPGDGPDGRGDRDECDKGRKEGGVIDKTEELASKILPLVEILQGISGPDEERVREIVKDCLKDMRPDEVVHRVEVKKPGSREPKNVGVVHGKFKKLLDILSVGEHAYLVGPPGTGKSHAAKLAAESLDLPYFEWSCSPTGSRYDLLGHFDINSNYVGTGFREAWENGGVFLLDEVDNGSGSELAVLNNGLANGHMSFPDGMIEQHEDFRLVMAANTVGHGATRQYLGRQALDGPFRDRVTFVDWGVDVGLESEIAASICAKYKLKTSVMEDWVRSVRVFRDAVEQTKLTSVIASPRAVFSGLKLLSVGWPKNEVIDSVIFKGVNGSDRAEIEKWIVDNKGKGIVGGKVSS